MIIALLHWNLLIIQKAMTYHYEIVDAELFEASVSSNEVEDMIRQHSIASPSQTVIGKLIELLAKAELNLEIKRWMVMIKSPNIVQSN